jgi:hypothetical protein
MNDWNAAPGGKTTWDNHTCCWWTWAYMSWYFIEKFGPFFSCRYLRAAQWVFGITCVGCPVSRANINHYWSPSNRLCLSCFDTKWVLIELFVIKRLWSWRLLCKAESCL